MQKSRRKTYFCDHCEKQVKTQTVKVGDVRLCGRCISEYSAKLGGGDDELIEE